MRAPMRPELVGLRGAADDAGEAFEAAQHSHSDTRKQQFADDGWRLPLRRHEPIEGAPTLATSSVWRWAVDRWIEP